MDGKEKQMAAYNEFERIQKAMNQVKDIKQVAADL
jgi:hypothetical protein